MSHQTEESKAHQHQVPKNDFHTLPIKDKESTGHSAVLIGTPGLNNDGVVTTQPGPVIAADQLAGVPVKSSEELDQEVNALNKPKPSHP